MASKYLSAGTAVFTASTRTISEAVMTPVFDSSDESGQRQVMFRSGGDLFYGRVASYVSGTSVILLAGSGLPAVDSAIDELFVLDIQQPHTYQDYLTELQSLVDDGAGKLTSGDLDNILTQAVYLYQHHKPFLVAKKVQGNGTRDYSLPAVFGSLWKDEFSLIKEIEYPSGSVPPAMLITNKDWMIYDDGTAQDGSNKVLRFLTVSPTATSYFVARFCVEMSLPQAGTQNFPDTRENFANITTLAASLMCMRLASKYAQSSDATISSDVVNYHDKSSKYLKLAKEFWKIYCVSVFGEAEPKQNTKPAFADKQITNINTFGGSALFHDRRITGVR